MSAGRGFWRVHCPTCHASSDVVNSKEKAAMLWSHRRAALKLAKEALEAYPHISKEKCQQALEAIAELEKK